MNRITITDRDGWRKEFTVQKSIVYIGSDPGNDIVLDGARGTGVAPRQLQLLTLASNGAGYRIVNLGALDVHLGVANDRALSPFGSTVLRDGEQIKVGDFTLVFANLDVLMSGASALPSASAAMSAPSASAPMTSAATASTPSTPPTVADIQTDAASTANSIGLRLLLPSLPLATDRPLEGTIVVRNQGTRPGAQFRLQIEGLDPTWYEIGPSPILFPNAEKEIPLRIVHPRKPSPPAGEFRFTVRASAPEAYPREVASVTQSINILPYYSHKLRFLTTG